MTNDSDNEVLATTTTGELGAPGDLAPVVLEGEQPEDMLLPSVHIFHDVGNESRDRGDHSKGTTLHSLSNEEIATAPRPFSDYDLPPFLPLAGYVDYKAWPDDRGDPPLYITRDRDWIRDNHPEHLDWGSGRDGKGRRAQRYINWIGLFEGREEPIVVLFTKQSIRPGQTIATLEKTRAVGNRTAGLYVITICSKSNDLGSWYVFGKVQPAGDPSEEFIEIARPWVQMLSSARVATQEMDNSELAF